MDLFDNIFVIITVVVVSFVFGLLLPTIHVSAIGEVEKIEALREMVNELGVDARTEDILGKVSDVNMTLRSAKRYNKIPLIQFFVPDRIANLDLIEIPKVTLDDALNALKTFLGE